MNDMPEMDEMESFSLRHSTRPDLGSAALLWLHPCVLALLRLRTGARAPVAPTLLSACTLQRALPPAARAGSGPNPNRNLTRGSRVFKYPNQTGSLFGEPEVTRGDIFLTRATRTQ